jgi:hypothetical protein
MDDHRTADEDMYCSVGDKRCRHLSVNESVERVPVIDEYGFQKYQKGNHVFETIITRDGREFCNDAGEYLVNIAICPLLVVPIEKPKEITKEEVKLQPNVTKKEKQGSRKPKTQRKPRGQKPTKKPRQTKKKDEKKPDKEQKQTVVKKPRKPRKPTVKKQDAITKKKKEKPKAPTKKAPVKKERNTKKTTEREPSQKKIDQWW